MVALSEYIPGFVKDEYNVKPVNQMSLFISHGEMDQILPYEWRLANHEYFQELGATVTLKRIKKDIQYHYKHNEYMKWIPDSLGK
ncbi:hypothetical protein ACFFHM_13395 [Halalkalibacter kiskunsagensis]|uniref:Phospholipase/carboxylesterase/thioesterase domain-containing protein n=1 Tax=Halalkalibacter kiskunsagensis TaxID=1548599 RepID=A0ABV6KDS3_9BACI